MILFRRYYKSVNDEINSNRELIDKIFDEYAKETEKKSKSQIYNFTLRYGTAFAAVLVLCVAVSVYPKFEKLNQEPELAGEKYEYSTESINETEEELDKGNDVTDYSKTASVKSDDTRVIKEEKSEREPVTGRIIQSEIKESKNPAMTINCQADISNLQSVTENEIELATNNLIERLGTADENTGNIYSFEIAGKLEANGNTYYLGRWRWLVDDHSSLICEFVLSDNLNEIYECVITENKVRFNTDNNLFIK